MPRIGLIVPSVNVVLEDDLKRFLPADVGAHVSRIPLAVSSREALLRAAAEAPAAGALLGDAGVGAIAFACTGGSLIGGPGSSEEIVRQIEEASNAAATTTTLALFEAFRALGMSRIALCSPFEDWFNRTEADFLESSGFKVVSIGGLNFRNPRDCAAISPEQIRDLALQTDCAEADGVFLSCANMRGFEAIAMIERELGKPVVSSNQVVLWALLGLSGASVPIENGGRLFQRDYRRQAASRAEQGVAV